MHFGRRQQIAEQVRNSQSHRARQVELLSDRKKNGPEQNGAGDVFARLAEPGIASLPATGSLHFSSDNGSFGNIGAPQKSKRESIGGIDFPQPYDMVSDE
jgi:hypothetical protein